MYNNPLYSFTVAFVALLSAWVFWPDPPMPAPSAGCLFLAGVFFAEGVYRLIGHVP